MQDVLPQELATATSETLQKFFEKANKNCTCNFSPPLFRATLKEYTRLRMEVHRVRKQGGKVSYILGEQVTLARHRLERFAPCKDCISRLNPTGRTNSKIWNPQRDRAYRECLT